MPLKHLHPFTMARKVVEHSNVLCQDHFVPALLGYLLLKLDQQ